MLRHLVVRPEGNKEVSGLFLIISFNVCKKSSFYGEKMLEVEVENILYQSHSRMFVAPVYVFLRM
jgi:hypothetical protein